MIKSFNRNITSSKVGIPRRQAWNSSGSIFEPDDHLSWSQTHAQMPTVALIGPNQILALYASRDSDNRSRIGSVVYSLPDFQIVKKSNKPVLDLGRLGTFDDSGVMPSSLIWSDESLYLYYVGWNRRKDVPYHNSVGLAVSQDNGETFSRVFEGPILDRNQDEPYFCATTCIRHIDEGWRCWYMSCTGWTVVDDHPEPTYDIKQASSTDGMRWSRNGSVAIPMREPDEAIARATVHFDFNRYHMWFCWRKTSQYREDGDGAYRIGYAYSDDGETWKRNDDVLSFAHEASEISDTTRSYPEVFSWEGQLFMMYNCREFGKGGFSLARLSTY